MPGELTKDFVKRYTQQKENLQNHFLSEKTGKQTLYTDQAKLFKPIIDSQKETSENLQNKITTNQDVLTNTIIPFTNEIKRRNDQVDELQSQPFYNAPLGIENVPQSTPKKDLYVNIDADLLDTTHKENLEYLNDPVLKFPLPSQIQPENYDTVLKSITKEKTAITNGIKKLEHQGEIEVNMSRHATLEILRQKIKTLQKTYSEFDIKSGKGLQKRERKLCKQKRGKGRPKIHPDPIIYNNANDLVQKLYELIIAKEAGNTGLDNTINAMLDELLETGVINKNDFDKMFKNIFNINK